MSESVCATHMSRICHLSDKITHNEAKEATINFNNRIVYLFCWRVVNSSGFFQGRGDFFRHNTGANFQHTTDKTE